MTLAQLTRLLVPRHPEQVCHESQLEWLSQQQDAAELNRLAQLMRWGNATCHYYHQHPIPVTEADYLEWLEGLPSTGQVSMRALGFEELHDSLPLHRYVLEKNDIGLSDYLCRVLSAADWQAYQRINSAALNSWLPPMT